MLKTPSDVVCEYIWIGGNGELRSKTKVLHDIKYGNDEIPEWNFDGSSTEQAPSDGNTEVIIKPCAVYKDPFRVIDKYRCFLILCETYDTDGQPLPTNHRNSADKIFKKIGDDVACWFGL